LQSQSKTSSVYGGTGGVTFDDCVVMDEYDRPVLVVVGTKGGDVSAVGGRVTVINPHQ
jgi:hypothetical protein